MYKNLSDALNNTGCGKANKHLSIQQKKVYNSFEGTEETIESFYKNFIAEAEGDLVFRLPKIEIALQWHKVLCEYCDMPGAIFAIRSGNTSGKLRRGWLTELSAMDGSKLSYFFTDNDFALYIYKMALDGYCPTVNEFYDAMLNIAYVKDIPWVSENKTILNRYDEEHGVERKFHMFPVHFLQTGGDAKPDDHYENRRNAFVVNGPVCCLGRTGYKHAHVFDAGKSYNINGKLMGMQDICDTYFPLGKVTEYEWDNEQCNYVREQKTDREKFDDSRRIARAMFLRFVDPLNHFLAPNRGSCIYTKRSGEISKDIAEEDELLDYIKGQNKIRYGKVFEEFSQIVFAPTYEDNDGSLIINLTYSSKKIKAEKKKNSNKEKASDKKSTSVFEYRGNNYSQRGFVYAAINDFIKEKNIHNFEDIENYFSKLIVLEKDVKDKKRYFDAIILPSGERVCISNQIGDGDNIPVGRRFTNVREKLKEYGHNM